MKPRRPTKRERELQELITQCHEVVRGKDLVIREQHDRITNMKKAHQESAEEHRLKMQLDIVRGYGQMMDSFARALATVGGQNPW